MTVRSLFAHLFKEPKYLPPEEFRTKREADLLWDAQRRYQEQKAHIDRELARKSREFAQMAAARRWIERAKEWAVKMDMGIVSLVFVAIGFGIIGWSIAKGDPTVGQLLPKAQSHAAGNPWTTPGTWYIHAHGKDVTWHDRKYDTAAECDEVARAMTVQVQARVVFQCEDR